MLFWYYNTLIYSQRKFIRDVPSAREAKSFFAVFEDWVSTQYTTVDLIEWDKIQTEDNSHVYNSSSTSDDYQPMSENVVLESGAAYPSYSPSTSYCGDNEQY